MNAKNADFSVLQGFNFTFNYKGEADQREEKKPHIIFIDVFFCKHFFPELCIDTYLKYFCIIIRSLLNFCVLKD